MQVLCGEFECLQEVDGIDGGAGFPDEIGKEAEGIEAGDEPDLDGAVAPAFKLGQKGEVEFGKVSGRICLTVHQGEADTVVGFTESEFGGTLDDKFFSDGFFQGWGILRGEREKIFSQAGPQRRKLHGNVQPKKHGPAKEPCS